MAGKPELLKQINLNLIYKALISLKSATRQEISDCTKISLTTVRMMLDELLEKEQIVEMQLDESSGGRRAQRYALNDDKNCILAFFIRENKLIYQIISLTQKIVTFGEKEVDETSWSEFATEFVESCCKKWDIIAISIGASGIVKNMDIYTSCSLNEFSVNNIGNYIKDKYNVPTFVENDLNAVAYGYAVKEVDTNGDNDCANNCIAYVDFDTHSVSAGFVANGKILKGNNQFSGELSFMPIEKNKTLSSIINCVTNKEAAAEIVGRVLSIINCIINPNEIIIDGKLFAEYVISIEEIRNKLKEYLSESVCPKITFSNSFEEAYMNGITRLAQYNVLELLPF